MTIARSSYHWSLGYYRQALRSLTIIPPTPAVLNAKAWATRCIVDFSLGVTYDPTKYQRFYPVVTVQLTTFVPKLLAPSTFHPPYSLQTMAIPSWYLLSASATHTL